MTLKTLAAALVLLGGMTAGALAQDPNFQMEEQDCQGDALRFCGPEIPDHAKTKVFQDFGAAVEFALSIADQDCFGGARIYRQQQIVVKDGKRSFIRWDDECFWDGINGTDQPNINRPDEWCA